MCGKKNTYTVILSVAVTLCVSLLICFILSYVYAKEQYGILSAVTEQLVAEYPADEQHIVEIIKNSRHGDASNVLAEYGFETIDFITPYAGVSVVTAVLFVIVFIILLIGINHLIKSSYKKRINELTKYLEQINSGDDVGILLKRGQFQPFTGRNIQDCYRDENSKRQSSKRAQRVCGQPCKYRTPN